jgi:hypothetical protein
MSDQNAKRKRSELSAIGTRFDPEVRKIIEAEAAADNRAVAHWIEKVVLDHLRGKGKLPR